MKNKLKIVVLSFLLIFISFLAFLVYKQKIIVDDKEPTLAIEQSQTPVEEEKPVVEPEIKKWTIPELLEVTNDIRAENGVKPLELDPNLNKSAKMKLDEMTKDGVFEHVSASGKNGIGYINDLQVPCYYVGENLQRVSPYVDQIRDFEGSDGHWKAVNNSDYESVGFAINDQYFVMHFCDKDI